MNVSFVKMFNQMKNENIVVPRIVQKGTLDFNDFCEYLADGTTISPGDVAGVMKAIETRLPLILGMNSQVVVSPEGLTFRPKVTGCLTQSELRTKLQQRVLDNPDAEVDVNKEIEISDMSINDVKVSLAVEIPKKWKQRFASHASIKRISKDVDEAQGSGGDTGGGGSGSSQGSGTDNP